MRYTKHVDGESFSPRKRGWRLMCCDCGLVHVLNIRTVRRGRGIHVIMQGRRDARATAAARRAKQHVRVQEP